MASIDLHSSSVLVLGGSGALGSRIAGRLADEGALITVAGRSRERLDAVAACIPGAATSVFDLSDPHDAHTPVDAAIAAHGRLDGIVNAAGVVAFGLLSDTDPEVIDEVIAVDLTGPLHLYRYAIPRMDGGFIVNLSGIVATMPTAGMATYSAAKAGLSAATVALTRELRRIGITVIDARPPHTETGLVDRAIAGEAPNLPPGMSPDAVADRIVVSIKQGERVLESESFDAV
ncbi:MAG TPA: SDR family NAD(P)-dependent oxidoreductase [Acidimicrobiia bacterium]|nr:SDR family NAD(P)-dependent oxidoreductase [Acidimicrobiia bacterium]